jgi:hypothetical protein
LKFIEIHLAVRLYNLTRNKEQTDELTGLHGEKSAAKKREGGEDRGVITFPGILDKSSISNEGK